MLSVVSLGYHFSSGIHVAPYLPKIFQRATYKCDTTLGGAVVEQGNTQKIKPEGAHYQVNVTKHCFMALSQVFCVTCYPSTILSLSLEMRAIFTIFPSLEDERDGCPHTKFLSLVIFCYQAWMTSPPPNEKQSRNSLLYNHWSFHWGNISLSFN